MRTMEYSVEVIEDLKKKVAQIENELADVHNQLALITAKVSNHKGKKRPPLDFPVDSYGSWPQDLSLRREDMYDEWER